jgi:hypothetical protein
MIRSLIRVTGAIAFFVFLAPTPPAAAPPPGLGYDEIVRVVVNATPPPPGNFQSDVAALNAPAVASTPTPAPKKRGFSLGNIATAVLTGGGAGSIAGSVIGDAASNAMENAMEAQLGAQFASLGASIRGFLTPHLLHYSFYNGWERVDDVTAQTATIRKCEIGQVVTLDLAKKTYAIYDPNSEPTPASAGPPQSRGSRQKPEGAGPPSAPGTAIFDVSATRKALGTLRMENLQATGYDSTAGIAISKSTGSCRDGSFAVKTTEYYSALARPNVSLCPVRRALVPQSASEVVAGPQQPSGGCRPTMTFHQSGPPLPTNKLALYSLVTMNASGGATPAPTSSGSGGVGFLTERGNLKTLDATAATLFDIPAGFTKAQER